MKIFSRFICCLLCICVFASALSVFGVGAEAQIAPVGAEVQKITSLEIDGFSSPVSGESATKNADSIYLADPSHLKMTATWYNTDATGYILDSSPTTFEKDKTYALEIFITTNRGYEFAMGTKITVATGFTVAYSNYTTIVLNKICVCTDAPGNINVLHLSGFTAPKQGDCTAANSADLKLEETSTTDFSAQWTNLDGSVAEYFEGGKKYLLSITLTAKQGFEFAQDITIYNCDSGMKITSATTKEICFAGTYECPPSVVIVGDCTGDGQTNIKDATAIQKFIASLATFGNHAKIAADVNRDDDVNIKDATMIQKFVASLIEFF